MQNGHNRSVGKALFPASLPRSWGFCRSASEGWFSDSCIRRTGSWARGSPTLNLDALRMEQQQAEQAYEALQAEEIRR